MDSKTTADIIIYTILTLFVAISFMKFMKSFNKKECFSSGLALSAIITTSTMLVNFIISNLNQ